MTIINFELLENSGNVSACSEKQYHLGRWIKGRNKLPITDPLVTVKSLESYG